MNPTSPTKPVMDVAAPKSPALAPSPFSQPSQTATRAASVPVRPAPFATNAPQPTVASSPLPTSRRPVKKPAMPQATGRTPVALITVTVFVMLVLSVLAVTVYVTSKTA